MKKHIYIGLAALVVAIALFIYLLPVAVHSAPPPVETKIEYVDTPTLSSAQVIWLAHLMTCESGINKKAVLKIDLDGTSSLGLLQFKQGTFDSYKKKYNLTGEIFDGNTQVDIVTYWILHPGEVDWKWQFPDCVRKYGEPPE